MSERDHSEEICRLVREKLPAFSTGDLAEPEAETVAQHLEVCAACAALVALEPELRQRLAQSVEVDTAPIELRSRIQQSISPERKVGPSRWRLAMAAAAVLLLLANIGAYFKIGILPHEFVLAELRIRASLEKIHALLGVGLSDHLICTVYRRLADEPPTEELTEREMGEEWAPLASVAAEYAPSGFDVRLAHRCGYGGREFVHIALHDGRQLISLIVTERRAGDSFAASGDLAATRVGAIEVYEGSADEFGVSAFETESHLVYLVSDLSTVDQAAAAAAYFPQIATFLASVFPATPPLD